MYRYMRVFWIAALAAAGIAPAARGSDFSVPEVRLPPTMAVPTIDGTVQAVEWSDAARMEGFGRGAALAPLKAGFWVGSDGKELFIAVVSETPPDGKLLSRFVPLPEDRDARTWLDDSIELVLAPNPHAKDQRRLFHAIINANGAIHDTLYVLGGNAVAWRGRWRTASQVIGDLWHFELTLPLTDLGLDSLVPGQPLGIRVGRNWQQTPIASQTEWSPLGGAYLEPETLPLVTWHDAAPVVQLTQLADSDDAAAHIKLTVSNPGAASVPVKVAVHCRPTNSAPFDLVRTMSVAPGETAAAELTGPALNEDLSTRVRVTSPDEKITYYRRDFRWRPARPPVVWTPDPASARKVQTLFAYYPSFHKIHFQADVSGLEEKDKVRRARLILRRQGSAEPLAECDMPAFAGNRSRIFWDVPHLGQGEYELAMMLDGVSLPPITHAFVRHVFPWERNPLGKSDVVVAPFTPIDVQGQTLSTILRKHTLGTLGLWDQVESLGEPLLAGPVRLELTAAGQTKIVAGEGRPAVKRIGTKVVTQSAWRAGEVQGTARAEWDYDGMMKWTLHIEPSREPVERLVLVVPLRDKLMPLLHACTDGLRFNYAGETPPGQGRVWDGAQAPRNSIVGSYVPYVWVGAEERGLSVFGENDRGWVTSPGIPCQELVRQGDVLQLRLNLIAQPAAASAPRKILIGFQATPTKPMPDGWRKWTASYGLAPPPGGRRIVFNGSCWSWGALTPCLDLYPRGEDFSLWEQYARTKQTGQVDEAFLRAWVERYAADETAEERQRTLNHVRYGFHCLTSKTNDLLAYTNARGVRLDTPEGQTFLDEWHRDAFTTRTWSRGGGVAYDLNPGESFRDYAMWYYKRMLETFVDHIYWDDIFMQSCFDVVGSEAYEMPDGTIQPASGLFDMRELVRRTAVLQHEMGRGFQANQVHLTNTAITPILSFAGSHLTWEDRVGEMDYQDRYSREYIRAESTGRQHGNVPFVLHLCGQLMRPTDDAAKAKRKWLDRTLTGVALVHEIRASGRVEVFDEILKILYDFGYGDTSTKVFNYWDPDLPVSLSRDDASHLVIARPDGAMVVACDYGEGGELLLSPDLGRLGFSAVAGAVDVETGQPLEMLPSGAVRLSLAKHDFKVVRLTARSPEEASR